MVLARWIEGQQSMGNDVGAEEGMGILRRYGDIPLTFVATPVAPKVHELDSVQVETTKVYPEISLEVEIERLAKRYLDLEFHKHKEIKMSREKFKDKVMEFVAPQPENFRGRVDTHVVVIGQIPVKDQCRLAGIDYSLTELNARDWPDDPQQYKTPQTFYSMWTDEGARFMNRKVQNVREELAVDERGGTEFDGVALYIAKPNILQTRFLDLPGTAVESGRASSACLSGEGPRLGYHWVDLANLKFGSLVCGRQK